MNNQFGNGEESHHPKKMLIQVISSFRYAFSGLFHVLLTQRNMRFHFCLAIWVISFAIVLKLSEFEKAYLFIVITFVISLETINTCIEALTDIISPDYHDKAKIAKDTAAAAVLIVSIGSVISAGYIMMPPFFDSLLSHDWWMRHYRDMAAVGIIVISVLGFWGTQVIRLPMTPLMVANGGASSFAICFLSRVGDDVLSFFALQFFSILLFHSLGRHRKKVFVPILSHIFGICTYIAAAFYIHPL